MDALGSQRLGFPVIFQALSLYESVTHTTQGISVGTLRDDRYFGHEACGLHGWEVRALSSGSKDYDFGLDPASYWLYDICCYCSVISDSLCHVSISHGHMPGSMPDSSVLHCLLKVKWKSLSCVLLFATPWTIQSMEFSRSKYWSLSLLQGIFPTQESNPTLLHCKWILYQLRHKERPRILEWVAYPFSSGSSWPRNRIRVCTEGGLFTNWAMRETLFLEFAQIHVHCVSYAI